MDDLGLLERGTEAGYGTNQPGLPARPRHPHFSDDSENLPEHRYGVKDFFPNYILDKSNPMDDKGTKELDQ
jgi:hypothetical protein